MSGRLFEYGGQWIGEEKGRAGYYRYWYDERSRRTRRSSLRSKVLEAAKEELIEIVKQGGLPASNPSKVLVSDVLAHYIDHKYPPAERAGQLVMQALTEIDSIEGSPVVADLTLTNQRHIWSYMSDQDTIKTTKTISSYCIALRAAVNFSASPQIVDLPDGTSKEIRLLTDAVPIQCSQSVISEFLNMPLSGRREYLPTFEELAKWIDAIPDEPHFRYVIIALNTWARNSAIFDLRVQSQVDFEMGLIDLNPSGRKQTKKRRPIIRLTDNLRQWLMLWDLNKPIQRSQDRVEKPLNALGRSISMPDMTCYTIRHFMASHCRRTAARPSKEQRSKWLGHVSTEGSRTTDIYERFDPDYLEEPMLATQEIIERLDGLTKRPLVAPESNVIEIKKVK